jgi:putative membrane protein
MDPYVPFCGLPPTPAELLGRWTLEPLLLGGLALALAAVLAATRHGGRRQPLAGWALVALLFVSPLCAASMALFSARVAQHLLLTLVAAPLLAPLLRDRGPGPAPAAAAFAALFWLWHAPAPYALTLQSDLAYWAMHLSLLGAAVLLWAALRARVARAPFAAALALAGTAAQMTLLSVLLIWSESAWHPWHALASAPYGLTALGDQALAGAFMWVAGGVITSALIAALVLRLLAAPPGGAGAEARGSAVAAPPPG